MAPERRKNDHTQSWLSDVFQYAKLPAERRQAVRQQAVELARLPTGELLELLGQLSPASPAGPALSRASTERDHPLGALAAEIPAMLEGAGEASGAGQRPAVLDALARWYDRAPSEGPLQGQILNGLARDGKTDSLDLCVELLSTSAPADAASCAWAFVPLFRQPTPAVGRLFPRLLEAIAQPRLAPLIIDLANFLTERRIVPEHPAADRVLPLAALFDNLVQQLKRFERDPPKTVGEVESRRVHTAEASDLWISLASALALLGDARAIPSLQDGLTIGHRRLRTEAAAALARLGDASGLSALVALAAEPVVRPQVLHWLSQLGELERVPEKYQSDIALAEGRLAVWLAEPSQFGVPPTSFELLDERTQAWPGDAKPVPCYLFRFDYDLPTGNLAGVGMAGPIVHALFADMDELSIEDIYAAFAGWCAEHADIYETDAAELEPVDQSQWRERADQLHRFGELKLVKIGHFFGEQVFVAQGERGGKPGFVLADNDRIQWIGTQAGRRGLSGHDAYNIYKGRRLLAAFGSPVDE